MINIRSNYFFTPQEYSCVYLDGQEINSMEDLLTELEGKELWDYCLTDTDEVLENGEDCVLVVDSNTSEARWVEIPMNMR